MPVTAGGQSGFVALWQIWGHPQLPPPVCSWLTQLETPLLPPAGNVSHTQSTNSFPGAALPLPSPLWVLLVDLEWSSRGFDVPHGFELLGQAAVSSSGHRNNLQGSHGGAVAGKPLPLSLGSAFNPSLAWGVGWEEGVIIGIQY